MSGGRTRLKLDLAINFRRAGQKNVHEADYKIWESNWGSEVSYLPVPWKRGTGAWRTEAADKRADGSSQWAACSEKTEAYALRAFLHFDLLRLFGPVYKTHKEDKSICYNTQFSLSGSDLLPASKVMEYVIADLKEAEDRLAKDPIIEEGPLLSDGATE